MEVTWKLALLWPARMTIDDGTVASVVSELASVTVSASVVGPLRMTVPVAAAASPSSTRSRSNCKVNAGPSSSRIVSVTSAVWPI